MDLYHNAATNILRPEIRRNIYSSLAGLVVLSGRPARPAISSRQNCAR